MCGGELRWAGEELGCGAGAVGFSSAGEHVGAGGEQPRVRGVVVGHSHAALDHVGGAAGGNHSAQPAHGGYSAGGTHTHTLALSLTNTYTHALSFSLKSWLHRFIGEERTKEMFDERIKAPPSSLCS